MKEYPTFKEMYEVLERMYPQKFEDVVDWRPITNNTILLWKKNGERVIVNYEPVFMEIGKENYI